jgi:hypothetical protein
MAESRTPLHLKLDLAFDFSAGEESGYVVRNGGGRLGPTIGVCQMSTTRYACLRGKVFASKLVGCAVQGQQLWAHRDRASIRQSGQLKTIP